ncbi:MULTISPECIES: sensor histidine kinase [unclassified Microbacterium]|uniref:sensor histidine kinase n=1 Tax=unclassified Microbacterium TaxID=2609290 RepID=UPI0012F78679|nr:histidine kinase [Microbacterium sp. MAH-37]MVQ40929.1 sensor histidine kinase [Microbacterium sp. MAH-37]
MSEQRDDDRAALHRDVEHAVRSADWIPSPSDDRVTRGGSALARGLTWLRDALLARGARRWYSGASISVGITILFFLLPLVQGEPPHTVVLWTVALAVFVVLFLASAPIAMALPARWRWVPATVLLLLSTVFALELDSGFTGLWAYVAVSYAISLMQPRTSLLIVIGLALAAFGLAVWQPLGDLPAWAMPLIILSTGVLMVAFARNIATLRLLHATRNELAAVAVEEERNRVGRDMHDILGHSLSAIAVKADLAAALSERDPQAAAREIREVQTLARSTLGDMRAVVSGYRQVRVASELASLRTLLPAAGLIPHLPTTTDEVPEQNRELFGWVLREAATNVIRHAQARQCWVTLSPHRITVEDDGIGPAEDAGDEGNGLRGLVERVQDAGGAVRIGRSRRGGFLLEVRA